MSCQKIVARDYVCVVPVGGKRYDVVQKRRGRHGGWFINEARRNLTRKQASRAKREIAADIKAMHKKIKRRRTPYP